MHSRYGAGLLTLAVIVLAIVVMVGRLGTHDDRRIVIERTNLTRTGGGQVEPPRPGPRTLDPYRGYGTWVDVFDYSPPYAGDDPSVTVADLDEMAADGVRTVYLQAARLDDRSPEGLEDRWLLAELLTAAHDRDLSVVAWYLPLWRPAEDAARVRMLEEFEILGHRFDGVALDIEWTGGDIEPDRRDANLVALSRATAALVDGPVGAIVFPPVLTEVVNDQLWPTFPWEEIAPSYDVWLPMSYWSFRSDDSGYAEGYAYNEESTRRLRANVGDPDVAVHGIGGIGGVDGIDDDPDPPEPLATIPEIEAFVQSLADTASMGGSIYDWSTLEPAARRRLAELFESGPGAGLGSG